MQKLTLIQQILAEAVTVTESGAANVHVQYSGHVDAIDVHAERAGTNYRDIDAIKAGEIEPRRTIYINNPGAEIELKEALGFIESLKEREVA